MEGHCRLQPWLQKLLGPIEALCGMGWCAIMPMADSRKTAQKVLPWSNVKYVLAEKLFHRMAKASTVVETLVSTSSSTSEYQESCTSTYARTSSFVLCRWRCNTWKQARHAPPPHTHNWTAWYSGMKRRLWNTCVKLSCWTRNYGMQAWKQWNYYRRLNPRND
jgi:hypothetical protein